MPKPSFELDPFRQRTEAVIERFRKGLPALLNEAAKLTAELTASVSAR